MRRWFAIALLALLPLQFSWAAVSAYCAHEADAPSEHLGHHQHPPHASADSDGEAGAKVAKAGSGHDCGHCHGGLLAPPGPGETLAAFTGAERPAAPGARGTRSPAPTPPERPQWRRLA